MYLTRLSQSGRSSELVWWRGSLFHDTEAPTDIKYGINPLFFSPPIKTVHNKSHTRGFVEKKCGKASRESGWKKARHFNLERLIRIDFSFSHPFFFTRLDALCIFARDPVQYIFSHAQSCHWTSFEMWKGFESNQFSFDFQYFSDIKTAWGWARLCLPDFIQSIWKIGVWLSSETPPPPTTITFKPMWNNKPATI